MAAMQACHELVPPDVMTAVLRQLVDAFVHDRARPEVMTLGLKTVRELCARMPLIMTSELLQVTRRTPSHWTAPAMYSSKSASAFPPGGCIRECLIVSEFSALLYGSRLASTMQIQG